MRLSRDAATALSSGAKTEKIVSKKLDRIHTKGLAEDPEANGFVAASKLLTYISKPKSNRNKGKKATEYSSTGALSKNEPDPHPLTLFAWKEFFV